MRSLRKYLPRVQQAEKETVAIMVRMPKSMKEEMERLAKGNGWKVSQVIRAGISRFIEEEKGSKSA